MDEPVTAKTAPVKLLHPPAGEHVTVSVPVRWAPVEPANELMLLVGYETEAPRGPGYHADGEQVDVLVPARLVDFVERRGNELVERIGATLALHHTQTAGLACHQRYVLGLHVPMSEAAQLGASRVATAMLDSCACAPAPLSALIEYRGLLEQHLGVTVNRPDAYLGMEEAFYPVDPTVAHLARLTGLDAEEGEALLTAGQLAHPAASDGTLSRQEHFDRYLIVSSLLHDRVGIWIVGENCD